MRLFRVRGLVQRKLIIFLVGVTLGYTLASCLLVTTNLGKDTAGFPTQVANHSNTLLIAVVTANQHLQSRAEAVRETW